MVSHHPLPLTVVVAAALVDDKRRVLIAQRPQGKSFAGLWEFPGGKISPNETPEQALARELEEELGIQTETDSFKPLAFVSYGYDSFHLLMPLFLCNIWQGDPKPKEHAALKWVGFSELEKENLLEADIPLIAYLKDYL